MGEIKSLVFVSNYFNHHQKFLSDEFVKILGDGYHFIETIPMEEERKNLGWEQLKVDYVVRSHLNQKEYQKSIN